jgi:hypothetical protein
VYIRSHDPLIKLSYPGDAASYRLARVAAPCLLCIKFPKDNTLLGERRVKTGFSDVINQKQIETNRRIKIEMELNWINHMLNITCFYAVEFWTGFMIKIPRSSSILIGLGSKFNSSGLNIQRWEMNPQVNFQPGSKYFVTPEASLRWKLRGIFNQMQR